MFLARSMLIGWIKSCRKTSYVYEYDYEFNIYNPDFLKYIHDANYPAGCT